MEGALCDLVLTCPRGAGTGGVAPGLTLGARGRLLGAPFSPVLASRLPVRLSLPIWECLAS